MWRFDKSDYKQLSLEYQALKEEKKKIEKVRQEAKREKKREEER
jgi:hypothetical protein